MCKCATCKFNRVQYYLGKYFLTHLFGNKIKSAQNNIKATAVVVTLTQTTFLINGLLIWNPSYKCLKRDLEAVCGPGVAAHVYNLRIREVEAGGSWVSFKKKKKSNLTLLVSLL